MTGGSAVPSLFVCPLCPLHCDDLWTDDADRWRAHGCPIAEDWQPASRPKSRGDVRAAMASFTAGPFQIVTSGVDLVTARALARWQRSGRIRVAVESDPSIAAVASVVSRDGGVGCTLGAMLDRADWVWTIGAVDSTWPRLASRSCRDELVRRGGHWHSTRRSTADQVADWAGRCRAGDRTDPLVDTWLEAGYAVVVVGPDAFPAEQAELAVAVVGRTIRERNGTSRAAWLTLDPAVTIKSVWAWQFNSAPPVSTVGVTDNVEETEGIGADQAAAAAAIRLGSPLTKAAPKVRMQIGGTDPGESLAEVFWDAGLAGCHHASMTIRGDGSVSLPLSSVCAGGPPTIAERLEELWQDRPTPLVQAPK